MQVSSNFSKIISEPFLRFQKSRTPLCNAVTLQGLRICLIRFANMDGNGPTHFLWLHCSAVRHTYPHRSRLRNVNKLFPLTIDEEWRIFDNLRPQDWGAELGCERFVEDLDLQAPRSWVTYLRTSPNYGWESGPRGQFEHDFRDHRLSPSR